MNKKNKLFYLISCLIIIILFVLACIIDTHPKEKKHFVEPDTIVDKPTSTKDGIDIKKLQESYQNTDIVGYLSIPNILNYPIVQAEDNEYYLRKLLDGSYAIKGTPFMDYRTSFGDRKILIYGHSGETDDFPFLPLHQYEEENFYLENQYIYLYSMKKKYTYKIYSSYLETEDYDYVNINSFRGLTWLQHIEKFQNKSDFKTDISLEDNSKILILQTCNIENLSISGRYRLVIGLLVNTEDNIFE